MFIYEKKNIILSETTLTNYCSMCVSPSRPRFRKIVYLLLFPFVCVYVCVRRDLVFKNSMKLLTHSFLSRRYDYHRVRFFENISKWMYTNPFSFTTDKSLYFEHLSYLCGQILYYGC